MKIKTVAILGAGAVDSYYIPKTMEEENDSQLPINHFQYVACYIGNHRAWLLLQWFRFLLISCS